MRPPKSETRPKLVKKSSETRQKLIRNSSETRQKLVIFRPSKCPNPLIANNSRPNKGEKLIITHHFSKTANKTSMLQERDETQIPLLRPSQSGRECLHSRFASKNPDTHRSIFTVSKSSLSGSVESPEKEQNKYRTFVGKVKGFLGRSREGTGWFCLGESCLSLGLITKTGPASPG